MGMATPVAAQTPIRTAPTGMPPNRWKCGREMRCATYAVMALERVASTIVSTADTVIPSFPETYPRPAGVQTTSDGQIGRGGVQAHGGALSGSRVRKRADRRRTPAAWCGAIRVHMGRVACDIVTLAVPNGWSAKLATECGG